MPLFRAIKPVAIWVVLLPVVAGARLAAADGGAPLTVQAASIGFGGQYKAGFWQPVRVTLTAEKADGVAGHLEIVVADGDQTPVAYGNGAELRLGPKEVRTVVVYAKSGPANAGWRVQLRSKGDIVWSQEITALVTPSLGSLQELIVGIGPPVGLESAIATIRRRSDSGLTTAIVQTATELPEHWWGYDGADQIVLATSDAAFLNGLSDSQRTAIVQWVELGGRLVLCAGARGAEVLGDGSPWKSLVPGELDDVAALNENSSLEDFTKTELPSSEVFRRERPRITKLKNVRGEILLSETADGGASPLIVRAATGLGQVTFVGLDLDHPSLREWKGRTRLIGMLLNREAAEQGAADEERHATISQLGYTDLIGQLRAALDQFPGVTLVNFTTVAMLTGAYLLLIGPGDYLLLSWMKWPRQATWITFPLVALGMIALAYGFGGQAHGSRVRLNQAEIVDIDLERQVARGTVWAHLYSPATAHFDLKLSLAAPKDAIQSPQGWLAWQGLPGDALGGLESRQVMLSSAEPYRVNTPGPEPGIKNVAVQTSASKSLSACWWARTNLDAQAELTLDAFGHLEGRFRNPLSQELTECIVVHGDKLYRLGKLAPGQQATIDPQQSLNLEWRLTQRRLEQSKDVSTPWEQDSTDVPRIVQMLMFHQAARGRSYTGLSHRYQPQLDFSELARLGQAILLGRAAEPVAEIAGAGDATGGDGTPTRGAGAPVPTTWTWYRILLPIK
jgi:hypothetical protein